MSAVNNIDYQSVAVTGSYDLNAESNVYCFTATSDIAYTYNLPAISCDGQEFKIYRFDSMDTATLTISSTNDIIYEGTTITSLSLNPSTAVFFISFNNKWYVKRIGRQGYAVPTTIFSGSFRDSTNPYISLSTSTTNRVIARFSYPGKNGMLQLISGCSVLVAKNSNIGASRLTMSLVNQSGAVIATTPTIYPTTSITIVNLGAINYNNLPTSPGYLYLTVNAIIVYDFIYLYSFTIYSKEWQ